MLRADEADTVSMVQEGGCFGALDQPVLGFCLWLTCTLHQLTLKHESVKAVLLVRVYACISAGGKCEAGGNGWAGELHILCNSMQVAS